MRNPSRAVLQFYPSSDDQIQLITSIAQKAGFGGGIVVDYPNSKKAKKVFLCLFVGGGGSQQVPQGLQGEEDAEMDSKARFERRREREKMKLKGKRKSIKDKDWILKKKEVCSSTILIYLVIYTVQNSSTANVVKRAYQTTPSSLDVNAKHTFEKLYSLYQGCTCNFTDRLMGRNCIPLYRSCVFSVYGICAMMTVFLRQKDRDIDQ
jgi:hypothetical protein